LGIKLGVNSARREKFHNFRGHDDMDGDLDAINLKIPTFQGKKDREAYLKWK
jgi:hypothetical protein